MTDNVGVWKELLVIQVLANAIVECQNIRDCSCDISKAFVNSINFCRFDNRIRHATAAAVRMSL